MKRDNSDILRAVLNRYDEPASATPETGLTTTNLNIKSRERAGNVQRQDAIAHVETMRKSGHLTGDEAGKRANYIKNAETVAEIKAATLDLPSPPEPLELDWDNPFVWVPVLVGSLMLFVSALITGGVALGNHLAGVAGQFGFGVLVGVGIIGTLASLVGILVKCIDP